MAANERGGALRGKVAVVTGSSRGVGRGVALALAEQGATVYVTGRTTTPGGGALAGSVGETVADCDARGAGCGGGAVGVGLDLLDDAAVAVLFEQVMREQGRLDILVNSALAIPETMTQRIGFWEKPLSELEILATGLRAAYVASWHAARIMAPQKSGLIVGISGYVGRNYTYDVLFGVTKTGLERMARDMAVELQDHGVASLALWQGFTFTERAQENLRTVPGMAEQLFSAAGSTPEFPGRVIAALAADPAIMEKTGGTFINAELAAEYGITDIDGKVIPSLRDERGGPLWSPVRATGA